MQEKFHQYLTALTAISRTIHDGVHPDHLFTEILRPIGDLFGAKGCSLRVLNRQNGALDLYAATGLSPAYLEKGCVLGDPLCSEVFEEDLVVITDVASDPRVQYPEAAVREGIGAIVSLPFAIFGDGRMVLRIYLESSGGPAPEELEILRSLAEHGIILIRNALQHRRYVDTFRKVSKSLHSGRDTAAILQSIVDHATEVMQAKGAIYWIVDSDAARIVAKVSSGFSYEGLAQVDYEHLKQLFDWERERLAFIQDARYDHRIPDLERLGKKRVVTVIGLPFAIVPPYRGILALYFGRERQPAPSEINFLEALGEQGAIALEKALRHDEQMLQGFRETIEGLVLALEAKDPVTHGHSRQVALLAGRVAHAMGLDEKERENIRHAALLHDIGKIGLGDRILTRLGKLSSGEMAVVRQHPAIGAEILRPLSFLAEVVPLVLHHHELFDGSGYPEGRKGDEIPLGSRIIAACDTFQTIIAGRPNIPRQSMAQALATLKQQAGLRFDPRVVEPLLAVMQREPELLSQDDFQPPWPTSAPTKPRRKDTVDEQLWRSFPPLF